MKKKKLKLEVLKVTSFVIDKQPEGRLTTSIEGEASVGCFVTEILGTC